MTVNVNQWNYYKLILYIANNVTHRHNNKQIPSSGRAKSRVSPYKKIMMQGGSDPDSTVSSEEVWQSRGTEELLIPCGCVSHGSYRVKSWKEGTSFNLQPTPHTHTTTPPLPKSPLYAPDWVGQGVVEGMGGDGCVLVSLSELY